MFGEVDRATANFATGGEPLQKTQQEQQSRCPEAGLRIGGQQAHGERGTPHQHDGDHKDFAATDAIAKRAKERGAQGPDDHPGTEGRQTGEQTGGRVFGRKKQRTKPDRECGEGQEVIPLQKGAIASRNGDAMGALCGLGGF